MITKYPFYAAPAFNELRVDDDTDTSIEVSEIGGRGRSVTLHHVRQNGVASFDLKNFVSKLFYDYTAVVPTPNNTGWAFLDYRLQTRYSVGGKQFIALNAVQDKGRSLDLLDEGDSGALTLRPIRNHRIKIPKYTGFPTGVSLMYKNLYGLDYSNATKATIVTTAANYTVILPWYFDGSDMGGYISWGDGSVGEMTARGSVADDRMQHVYAVPGQYEIAWVPAAGTKQHIAAAWSDATLVSFATVVRSYTQFSERVYSFSAYGLTGLQRIEAVLPGVSSAPSYPFRDCTNLNYINPEFFSNIRAKVTNLAYAFTGTVNLTGIDASLISGLTNVTSLSNCFNSSGITNFSAPMFALMSKVTDCAYAFRNSKLQTVPDGMFSAMRSLNNVTGIFYECGALTSIGANVFNSSAADIRAESICYGCTALTKIQSTSFKGLTNITEFNRAFYKCAALAALPAGIFAGIPKVRSFEYGFCECTSLTAVPQNIFDSWTALGPSGMDFAFLRCSKLSTVSADIFKYNTTLTSLSSVFGDCSALTSLDLVRFFGNMPQLRSASGTFFGCGFTSLPLGMFTAIRETISLPYTFRGCRISNLPTVSGGRTLFTSKCTDLSYCFQDNKLLTGIPGDMLDVYEGAANIRLRGLFSGCTGLSSVPESLFTKAGAAITDITRMFAAAGQNGAALTIPGKLLTPLKSVTSVYGLFTSAYLSGIPTGLFAGMPQLTDISQSFSNTEGVTTIPPALFAGNPNLVTAARTFERFGGYNVLASVPESLFDNCPLLTDVSGIFNGCVSLKNVGNIFRRNPLIANFNQAFDVGGYNVGALTGSSPRTPEGYRLWERAGKPGYPAAVTGALCFRNNDSQLSDRTDIPSDWK